MISLPNTSDFAKCTYAVEPPYTERYVRWCERSVGEVITYLLLDRKKPPQADDG